MTRMAHDLVRPPKARRGERIAVLSPSSAAAGAFPAVHEQAMCRLTEVTGLIPVEYPTTRKVGATSLERAADINAAFADPAIRGILAVVGGRTRLRSSRSWMPGSPVATPSPSSGRATAPTFTTGCGRTASRASTAAPPRCISAPGPASTTSTPGRCGPLSSPAKRSRSPTLASRKMSGWTGATRAPWTASVSASLPSRGAGTGRPVRSPAAPGAAALRSSSGSSPQAGSLSIRTSSTAAFSSSKPQKNSSPRATSGGSSARWGNVASSGQLARCSWPARQYLTSPAARPPPARRRTRPAACRAA
jgi:hypothetical protein